MIILDIPFSQNCVHNLKKQKKISSVNAKLTGLEGGGSFCTPVGLKRQIPESFA